MKHINLSIHMTLISTYAHMNVHIYVNLDVEENRNLITHKKIRFF